MPYRDYTVNLKGRRFGRLKVLRSCGRKWRYRIWVCSCSCGGRARVAANDLLRSRTLSCGCLQRELTSKRNYKHGNTIRGKWTIEYSSWSSMMQRCSNPKSPKYEYYGGRGIKVCKAWRDFRNFLADMGKRPGLQFSLERINNNVGYRPSNCKWALRKDQYKNRRTVLLLQRRINQLERILAKR
jgi:hypothetical protein